MEHKNNCRIQITKIIDKGSQIIDTRYMSKKWDTDAQITCQHIILTGPHIKERERKNIEAC